MADKQPDKQLPSKLVRRQRMQQKRNDILAPEEKRETVASAGATDPTMRLINPLEFTAARSEELSRLHTAIGTPFATRRAFQTLPRHLRKRTASHNPKKLPVKLRERAIREVSGSAPKGPGKKPPRIHKRRPSYLREAQIKRATERKPTATTPFDAAQLLSDDAEHSAPADSAQK